MKRLLCASIYKIVTTLLLFGLLFVPFVSVVGVAHRGSKDDSYGEDMGLKLFQVMSVEDAEDWDGADSYQYVRLANLNEGLHIDLGRGEGLERDDMERLSLFQIYKRASNEIDRLTEEMKELGELADEIDDLDVSEEDKSALKNMAYSGVASSAWESLGVALMALIGIIVISALATSFLDGISGILTACQGMTKGIPSKNSEKTEKTLLRKTRSAFYKPCWILLGVILYLCSYGIAMQGTYSVAMGNSKFLFAYTGLRGYRVLVEPAWNPLLWLAIALAVGILTHIIVKRCTPNDCILFRDED